MKANSKNKLKETKTKKKTTIKSVQYKTISDKIFSNKESEIDIKELIFNILNKKKLFSVEKLNHFIINNQKEINKEYSNLCSRKNIINESNKLEKLISLISRYLIIIYYLISINNSKEAKNLLLLMIKENIKYIDFHAFRLFKIYNKLLQKYEIINVYPKNIKEVLKIYSIFIKYCSLFNLSKYKEMFLVRYLSLHSLNYKIFKRKFEIRGFSVETRKQLKYLFSIGLHYASFFSCKYFCPMKVSISLSGLILKVYRNLDDKITSKEDKSLIIKTLYNQSIFYYLSNQADNAIRNLRMIKQKTINNYNQEKLMQNFYNKFSDIFNFNKINNENNTNKDKRKNNFKSLNSQLEKPKDTILDIKIKEYSFHSYNDFIEQLFLNEGNRRKTINLESIIDIFGLDNINFGINDNNKNLKKELNASIDDNKIINNDIDIPNYLKEPLFLNIELFMAEIEIDRKNYYMSYEHLKNCLILILISKKESDSKNYTENQKKLIIVSNFLEEIEKNNQNKKFVSQIKSLQNLSSALNKDEKMNKLSSENNKEKEIIKINDPININNEIEKLFLFLNSLSVYQIKILNETQPPLNTRNELPLFFSSQFKDTLSPKQRNNLDKLNIMSVSRYSLLLNPNNSILPSNLKFKYIKNNDDIQKIGIKTNILFKFNGNLMNNNYNSITEEKKENEKEMIQFNCDNEIDKLKELLLSIKKNNKLKKYLLNNIYYVYKILANSNKKQINNIIKYPEIIIEPIKLYQKKYDIGDQKDIIQKEILSKLNEIPELKSLIKLKKTKPNEKLIDNKAEQKSVNLTSSISLSSEVNILTNSEQNFITSDD